MDPNHLKSYRRLEQTKEKLLTELSNSDLKVIATRKNGKWSPVEQCYHVYLAEHLSRRYCIKKLSFNPKLDDAGIQHRFRLWALKAMEIAPIKFKAPKTINEQAFPSNLDLERVQKEWSQDRKELKEFLENLNPDLVSKEIYKQPSVGRLTIGGMLEFFQFHLERHNKQIKNTFGIG